MPPVLLADDAQVISSEDFPLSVMGIIHCRQVVDQYALMTEATVGAYVSRLVFFWSPCHPAPVVSK